MADDRDPPPLFNNVNLEKREDDDDLFSSAMEDVGNLDDDGNDLFNGAADAPKLQLSKMSTHVIMTSGSFAPCCKVCFSLLNDQEDTLLS
ncbi:unnamed protein product [Timema podura]|uniref:Uncharacterized protein n=1 Tax=Timema podura TaxID=61482 RepID=A0ABN7P412_TIMPD|nr:unnamed protein product [Timema podura]